MKRKGILFLGLAAVCALGSIAYLASSGNIVDAITGAKYPDCNYYQNSADFTSIYDINCQLADDVSVEDVKTWGTVTKVFSQNSYYNAFIQSTDKNGNAAGLLLYKVNSVYSDTHIEEGDFVIAEGDFIWYNGMPELDCSYAGTVTIKSETRAHKVDTYQIPSKYLKAVSGTDEWEEIENMGTRQVVAKNVTIKEIYDNKAIATGKDGSGNYFDFQIYYGSVNSDAKEQISYAFSSTKEADEEYGFDTHYDIIGFMNSYKDGYFQLLIKDTAALGVNTDGVDCDGKSTETKYEITLSESKVSMTTGETLEITADFYPKNKEADYYFVILDEDDYEVNEPYGTDFDVSSNFEGTATGSVTVSTTLKNPTSDTYTLYCQAWFGWEIAVASCRIDYVKNVPEYYSSISFNQSTYNITSLSSSKYFFIEGTPEEVKNDSITVVSSDESVCYVSDDYIVPVGEGTATLTATAAGGATATATVVVDVSDSIEIDFADVRTGTYSTNFSPNDSKYYRDNGTGVKFQHYRSVNKGSYLRLFPSNNLTTSYDGSLPGAFISDTLPGATGITLSYMGAGVIRYGVDFDMVNTITLPSHTTNKESTFKFDSDAAYISIEANANCLLDLYEAEIPVKGKNVADDVLHLTSDKRIPVTKYSGELIDGVSYVDVPTNITISGNKYTVKSTKRYTYYSFDYVQANYTSLDLDEIAMTDPVDVANYYQAFHALPANYYSVSYNDGTSWSDVTPEYVNSKSTVNTVFGTLTRGASLYARTGGYTETVPCTQGDCYIEFDFDADGTYQSNRGVNRVVIWPNGWTNTNGDPAAVYTDDHYQTFKEYLNYGSWGTFFRADDKGYHRVNYTHGTTTTLSK